MVWNTILFDLDGTLTDSKEGIINSMKYALAAMGCPVPPEEELLQFIGPPLMDSFQVLSGMGSEWAVQALVKYRERYSTVGLFENKLYEGMEEVLATLQSQGYCLAVATSKPEEYSVKILEHFGVAQYFTEIVGSTLDRTRDKKSEVIQEALRRLHLTGEQTKKVIMVGDRKYDILGAKKCGIQSLGVYYGFAPKGELEEYGADYIIHEVSELLSFFG